MTAFCDWTDSHDTGEPSTQESARTLKIYRLTNEVLVHDWFPKDY